MRNTVGEQQATVQVMQEVRLAPTVTPSPPPAPPPRYPITVLDCTRTADTIADPHWTIDGERLEPDLWTDRMHVLANGTLVLGFFADAAELQAFECVRETAKDGVVTRRASLETAAYMEIDEEAPRVEISQPDAIDASVGDDVRLDCALVTGPALTTRLRWTQENVNLNVYDTKFLVKVSARRHSSSDRRASAGEQLAAHPKSDRRRRRVLQVQR